MRWPSSVRVTARVVELVGDNTTFATVAVVDEGLGRFLGIAVRASDGRVMALEAGGAVQDVGSVTLDGTAWVTFERHAGAASWWYGNGTTKAPPGGSGWQHIRTEGLYSSLLGGADLGLGLAKNANGVAGGCTIGDVTVTSL